MFVLVLLECVEGVFLPASAKPLLSLRSMILLPCLLKLRMLSLLNFSLQAFSADRLLLTKEGLASRDNAFGTLFNSRSLTHEEERAVIKHLTNEKANTIPSKSTQSVAPVFSWTVGDEKLRSVLCSCLLLAQGSGLDEGVRLGDSLLAGFVSADAKLIVRRARAIVDMIRESFDGPLH